MSGSIERLYAEINAPARFATPAVTVEAIMYSVRTRGLAALNEPDTRERLSRCDDTARKTINERIAKLCEEVKS